MYIHLEKIARRSKARSVDETLWVHSLSQTASVPDINFMKETRKLL